MPLTSSGTKAEHLFAFLRRHGEVRALVAVPRLWPQLIAGLDRRPLGPPVWQDTRLLIPAEVSGRQWTNIFTGEHLAPTEHDGAFTLEAAKLFAHFPVALLVSEREA